MWGGGVGKPITRQWETVVYTDLKIDFQGEEYEEPSFVRVLIGRND